MVGIVAATLQTRSRRVGGDTRRAPAAFPLSPSEVWICSSCCSWQARPSAGGLCGCCPDVILKSCPEPGDRMEVFLREHFQFLCCSSGPPLTFVWYVLCRGASEDQCVWWRSSWPPLHHRRHLTLFALVSFYSPFTGFQYRSVTAPFLFIHHPLSHSSPFSSSFSLLQSPAVTFCFPSTFLALRYQTSLQLSSFPSPTHFLSSSHQLANVPSAANLALRPQRKRMKSTEAVLLICSCLGSWL